MAQFQSGAAREDPPPALVRAELDRLLTSELFTRSDRLSAFLKFIVEQTLSGHGDTLKEQVIATELYGKGSDFNTAADPIVRVDARRLRDRLREYYASAPTDSVVISVPKGSYTPVFERNGRPPLPAPEERYVSDAVRDLQPAIRVRDDRTGTTPESRRLWALTIGVVVVVLGLATAFVVTTRRGRQDDGSAPRLLTVTSLPDAEEDPSLSPDASFVTFSWSDTAKLSGDIWVKAVDGDAVRQLTDTPEALEKWPEWSPDGQYISFTRLDRNGSSVFVVSPLGGPERMVTNLGGDATWLPDSRSLIMVSRDRTGPWTFVHHNLASGERRQLLEAPSGYMLVHPKVSHDGRTVLYSMNGEGRSSLFLMPVHGGQPKQLGSWYSGVIGSQAWSPDGREVFFGRPGLSGRQLVRMPISGSEPPVPIAGVPLHAIAPAVSRPSATMRPARLAFVSGEYDVGLRMIDLHASGPAALIGAVTFVDSARQDTPGRFSPDGTKVAFVSNRSGSYQVWVAERDGSELRSVTRVQDAMMSIGSWSPDGQWIAFDATIAGNADIYSASVDGGALKRLTTSRAMEIDPEWSRDGRWIYFSSTASGSAAIWKMPASGGSALRLTSDKGFDPRESPDGETIYFFDRARLFGLNLPGVVKRVSKDGGPATKVAVAVMPGAWDVTDRGIVFLKHTGMFDRSTSHDVLALYDFADERVHEIGQLDFRVARAITSRYLIASRDGRWVVAPHIDQVNRDIMVLDSFR